MLDLLSLIPQINLDPVSIAAATIAIGVAVVMLSCALAGLFHKSPKNDIRKWG